MVLRNQLFLNLWLPLATACSSVVRPCCSFWKFWAPCLVAKKKSMLCRKVEVFKGMKLPWVLFLFWEFWLRRPMIGGFKPWFSSLCVYFLAQTSIRSLMKFLIGQYGFLYKFFNHVDSPNILLVMAYESDQVC